MTLPRSDIGRFGLSVWSTWVLSATVQADPRDVSYTYMALGQIASVDGPWVESSRSRLTAFNPKQTITESNQPRSIRCLSQSCTC
jgi:hypothetical protein